MSDYVETDEREPEKESSESDSEKELLETAKKRFELCVEAERDIREQALDDLRFLAGDQWPEHIKRQKEAEGSVLLTINRLPAMLHQVSNSIRQNRVTARVSPVDDKGDVDTADIMQGHIRHIEYDSQAVIAYTNAGFYGAGIGMGYYEIYPKYSGPKSFEQDIKICMIENPFTILVDPNAVNPDASDAEYYFKITDFKKEEYKEAFPKSKLTEGDWDAVGAAAPDWITNNSVRVVEYSYKDKTSDILYQLKDGSSVLKSELEPGDEKRFKLKDGKPVMRPTETVVVKWCKLNGAEVLESTTKPGQYLGLVRVSGDRFNVDGKRIVHGVIRNAKEPQRQYNYMKSAQTQAIALTPKAKWLAAEGQIDKKQRKVWEESNVKNHVVLEWKQVDIGGKSAPPPQHIMATPDVSAITEALMEAHADLQYVTGIHDAQMGAKSNEKSGIAIEQRKVQGETGNFHYVDNLTLSIGFGCRQIVDMAPVVYDTKRSIRIIGEDDTHKVVKLNQATDYKGAKKTFRYDVGKYDIVASAGPSWPTKLQEAADVMTSLVKSFPQIMPVAGDLVIKGLNIPYGNELAERLKKTLPPELQDKDENDPKQQAHALQGQLAQSQQQLQHLNAYAQQLEKEKEGKVVEQQAKVQIAQMEITSKESIIKMQEATKIAVAEINASKDAQEGIAQRELEQYKLLHGSAHEAGMQAVEHSHAHALADKQAALAQTQQVTDQAHESDMADKNAALA